MKDRRAPSEVLLNIGSVVDWGKNERVAGSYVEGAPLLSTLFHLSALRVMEL